MLSNEQHIERYKFFQLLVYVEWTCLIWLKVDPQMDNLRDDLRFKDLVKRMNLPERN